MTARLSPRLPRHQVAAIDDLVQRGEYIDRGDVIRTALRLFLQRQEPTP